MDDLLDGQHVSGELQSLLDGNGGGDARLAKGLEFFTPLRPARVHLCESGSAAGGIGIGVGEDPQTFGRGGMRRFQFRAKMPAKNSLLGQRLAKCLDGGGDPVKAGYDFGERRKPRPEILAFLRPEVQQVLQPGDRRRESPVVRFRAFGGSPEKKRRANREAVAERTQGQAHLLQELLSGIARPDEAR